MPCLYIKWFVPIECQVPCSLLKNLIVEYYEIWAKAVDDNGVSQPMVVPGWNPKGYLNNSCHRIAVQVI